MFILIMVLALVAMTVFIILSRKTSPRGNMEFSPHDLFFGLAWVCGIIAFAMLITICSIVPQTATGSIIDEKIAMYQEENEIIEQDIDRIVAEYLKHEQDTFTELKPEESSITLITLFPELKSDTLVQQQLEIYVANNAKIKDLKEEKINLTKLRWLVYFGK